MPVPAIIMAVIGAAASAGVGSAAQYGVSYGMKQWRARQQRDQYQSWTDQSPQQWRRRRPRYGQTTRPYYYSRGRY